MDIHLPSVSALAKCFTKSFSKVYDGGGASEFDGNVEIIAPLSVWMQHKLKCLPTQNKFFGEAQAV